jgi:hypothetical protein
VQFDHDGEWSAAARREETRQQGLIAVSEIFHVCNVNVICCLCTGGHVSLLFLVSHRIGVGVGYTAMGLLVKPQRHTQKIERKHLLLRTRIKRLVRKTICFSKSLQMHDIVIGLFVNRYAFGLLIYSGHLHI